MGSFSEFPNDVRKFSEIQSENFRCSLTIVGTVAHRGHRFNKEKTLQIKEFLANTKNTSKISTPIHCKQKGNCKKNMCIASKKIAQCKQNSRTLQTRENLTVKRVHITSKRITRCKQDSPALQTRKKLKAAFTNYRSFEN